MVAKRLSSILGPDGQPVEMNLLTGEIAAPEVYGPRMLSTRTEATGLSPERLGQIMRSANHGLARAYLTLAIDMEERYLHYRSQLQTRKLALDGVDVNVTAPKGVRSEIVDFVQSLVDQPIFRDACQHLMDGVGKGYSVVEPVWEYQQNALRPVVYNHRDPRYFRYDEVGLRTLHLLDDSERCGEMVKSPYFIKHEPILQSGVQIRAGLARSAAWAFMVQQFTLQDWASFCELYGTPLRVGKYGRNATVQDQMVLLRAVRSIGSDAAAIIPADMEISFQQMNGSQGHNVYERLINYTDKKISMLVIGQTMTAEDGSSLGQAKVHNEVRHDIMRADGRQLSATINRDLIQPAVAMNFGPQDVYPTIAFEVTENDDIKAIADAIGVGVPLGLKVSQNWFRKKIGAPDPQEGEDLLKAPEGAKPKAVGDMPPPSQSLSARLHGSCGCNQCQATRLAAEGVDPPDETDELVDEQLSDWQKITDPLLEELFAMVNEASSFEEVQQRLDALRVDSRPLAEKLARAMAIARGLGDLKD